MEIDYYNNKVKKVFTNYRKMQKLIGLENTRAIKKLMDHFKASDNFSIFLLLGLGKPERLSGYKEHVFSVRVNKNIRLLLEVSDFNEKQDYKECKKIRIKGVCDYHGRKYNWLIP